MAYFASDFENVDRSDLIQKFTHCLRLQQSLPFYQYYKQKTYDLLHLHEGMSVLEVGCGTGEDAIALAKRVGSTGKVVAVDRSQAMLNQAIASAKDLLLPIEFVQVDAQHLPFAANTFAGARVDRTLQHIAHPDQVISEMARVVSNGGRIVAFEPDWETFVVNSDNYEVTRQLLNFWCDSFPSRWVGRNLTKYFHRAGLIDIEISPETLVITGFDLADQIFDLVQTALKAQELGVVSQRESEEWLAQLRQFDRDEEFFCGFTAFMVSGKK